MGAPDPAAVAAFRNGLRAAANIMRRMACESSIGILKGPEALGIVAKAVEDAAEKIETAPTPRRRPMPLPHDSQRGLPLASQQIGEATGTMNRRRGMASEATEQCEVEDDVGPPFTEEEIARLRAWAAEVDKRNARELIADEIGVLLNRIARAAAVLAAAPDTVGDDASKRLARDVAAANRQAWAILTENMHPPSRRATHPKERTDAE